MSRANRILIVDDDAINRELLDSTLQSLGYETELAADGIECLAKMKLDIDLVLLDVMMPRMDGFEVARRIRQGPKNGDVPVVIVTALKEKEDRIRGIEAGADEFISKPVDKTELSVRLRSLLEKKDVQDELKRHRLELEERVQQRTADLREALQEMAEAQRRTYEAHLDTIQRLVVAAEYKDEDTSAHIQRMSRYSASLGRGLGLSSSDVEILLHASSMHDVGKIGTPDAILLKPGKLGPDEWEIMKQHTLIGANILRGSPSELLKAGEEIALTHHEKWDGSGYPKGLAGEDIPLWGRICAVADVFDALTSERPYKKAMPNGEAYQILQEGKGRHFDPRILDLFFTMLDEVEAIQRQCQETGAGFGASG